MALVRRLGALLLAAVLAEADSRRILVRTRRRAPALAWQSAFLAAPRLGPDVFAPPSEQHGGLRQVVLVGGPSDVEDQAVGLAGVQPEPPAAHLDVEGLAPRRTGDDHAVGDRQVGALGEHGAVADRIESALAERFEDLVAVLA